MLRRLRSSISRLVISQPHFRTMSSQITNIKPPSLGPFSLHKTFQTPKYQSATLIDFPFDKSDPVESSVLTAAVLSTRHRLYISLADPSGGWSSVTCDQYLNRLAEIYHHCLAVDDSVDVVVLLPRPDEFKSLVPAHVQEDSEVLLASNLLPLKTQSQDATSPPISLLSFQKDSEGKYVYLIHPPTSLEKITDLIPSAALLRSSSTTALSSHTSYPYRSFPSIALGGTFDHIHAGHKLLLSASLFLAQKKVVIGITEPNMLKRKFLAELIEPLPARCKNVLDFMRSIVWLPTKEIILHERKNGDKEVKEQSPSFLPPSTAPPQASASAFFSSSSPSSQESANTSGLEIHAISISDPFGPAIVDPNFQAMVVSEETEAGVAAINEKRKAKGLSELKSEVIRLVAPPSQQEQQQSQQPRVVDASSKLSSSSLRFEQLLHSFQPFKQQQQQDGDEAFTWLITRRKSENNNDQSNTSNQEHEENKITRESQASRNFTSRSILPFVVGICGTIASGKSSACKRLQTLANTKNYNNVHIIDCDKIGHSVYLKGKPCYFDLIQEFGAEIVNEEDREINRRKLGALVFPQQSTQSSQQPENNTNNTSSSSVSPLQKLNNIVWPRIKEEVLQQLQCFGPNDIVIVEAAVLLQAGWQHKFTEISSDPAFINELWCLSLSEEETITRLQQRNNFTREQAIIRIQQQIQQQILFEQYKPLVDVWLTTAFPVEKTMFLLEQQLQQLQIRFRCWQKQQLHFGFEESQKNESFFEMRLSNFSIENQKFNIENNLQKRFFIFVLRLYYYLQQQQQQQQHKFSSEFEQLQSFLSTPFVSLNSKITSQERKLAESFTLSCSSSSTTTAQTTQTTETTETTTKRTLASFIDDWWSFLLQQLQKQHRQYHNQQHLFELFVKKEQFLPVVLMQLQQQFGNNWNSQQQEFEIDLFLDACIFFHDLIYETTPVAATAPATATTSNTSSSTANLNNERQSAQIALEFFQQLQQLANNNSSSSSSSSLFSEIITTIITTEAHQQPLPTTTSQAFFLDLDLAILGASQQRYLQYQQQIRQEYQFVPDSIFREKRFAILRQFLSKLKNAGENSNVSLFRTKVMKEKMTHAACFNIEKEMEILK